MESTADPVLPYAGKIITPIFNNGPHEISAELDVAGRDKVLSKSTTYDFKNYLLKVDTGGYLAGFIVLYDYTALIITGSEGEVLKTVDITNTTGEVLSLLPPSDLDGTPPYFSVTILAERFSPEFGHTQRTLQTDVSLFPWATYLQGKAFSPDSLEKSNKLTVEVNNVSYSSGYSGFITTDESYHKAAPYNSSDAFSYSFDYSRINQLVTLVRPDGTKTYYPPRYNWEKSFSSLEVSSQDTITYDAADFKDMTTHTVSHATDLGHQRYSYAVSAERETWSHGKLQFPPFAHPRYDSNQSEYELGMYVPNSHHWYETDITMFSEMDYDVTYNQQLSGPLPNKFKKVEASGTASASEYFEEVDLQLSGSVDYVKLLAQYADGNFSSIWYINLPDTMETYMIPKIPNFIPNDYLFLNTVSFIEREHFEGYQDFFNARWGSKEMDGGSSHSMKRTFNR